VAHLFSSELCPDSFKILLLKGQHLFVVYVGEIVFLAIKVRSCLKESGIEYIYVTLVSYNVEQLCLLLQLG
jgi:hypothetical protein